MEQINWVDLTINSEYEIYSEFPYQIRRKKGKRILTETVHKSSGYYRVYLNRKTFYKHRLIAQQFIQGFHENCEIDHINRVRSDNRIENLRIVTRRDNCLNKSFKGDIIYNYVDETPDDTILLDKYGEYEFEFYYFSEQNNEFYYYNGVQYRVLHINERKKDGFKFIHCYDTNGIKRKIALNKFKKLYGIIN